MMSFMRKRMKLIFIIILLAIIPGFTLWGIVSVVKGPQERYSGELYGHKVKEKVYTQAYMASYWNAQLANRQIDGERLNSMAWDRLILLKKADDYGITISDEEVARFIHQIFSYQGQFDKRLYIETLRRNNISPMLYEQEMRNSLKIEKLNTLVMSTIKTTDYELYLDYLIQNEELIVDYIKFNLTSYMEEIQVDDDQLIAYYEENQENYEKPEETNVKYIETKIDDYITDEKISDEQAQEYFEEHRDEYTQQAQVKASHVLFKVSQNASDDVVEAVKKKAEEVLQKAKDGEDFAALAREYSEGPTGPNGGDLGFFGRGQMVAPFEEAAFSLKAEEVYPELVRTQFGFHIIKVFDVQEEVQKEFADVKDEVIAQMKRDAADAKARQIIEEIYFSSEDLSSMETAASQAGLKVKETGFFSSPYSIPGIGMSQDFYKQAFELNMYLVGEIVKTDAAYYLLSPIERRTGVIPEFAEVRDRVERDYKRARALEMAHVNAEQALTNISEAIERDNETFSSASEKFGYEPVTSSPFTRRSPDASLGYAQDFTKQLFALPKGSISQPIETSSGVVVVYILNYDTPSQEEFQAEKEQHRAQYAMQKQYMILQEWINQVKQEAKLIDMTRFNTAE